MRKPHRFNKSGGAFKSSLVAFQVLEDHIQGQRHADCEEHINNPVHSLTADEQSAILRGTREVFSPPSPPLTVQALEENQKSGYQVQDRGGKVDVGIWLAAAFLVLAH